MICEFLLLTIASTAYSGYSGSSSDGNKVGDGYGYGYSGSFSHQGGTGTSGPFSGPFPNFDFNNFLTSYLDSLRKYHQDFAANLQQAQPNGFVGYGFPGGFPAFAAIPGNGGQFGFGGNFGGEGAAASASINPEGVHQTAGVFPENPNNPNINTRFGATPQEGGGFYSVSTSSQSGSSNIDGKPSSFHQASTTVNDNGKVTTYTVRKP